LCSIEPRQVKSKSGTEFVQWKTETEAKTLKEIMHQWRSRVVVTYSAPKF